MSIDVMELLFKKIFKLSKKLEAEVWAVFEQKNYYLSLTLANMAAIFAKDWLQVKKKEH